MAYTYILESVNFEKTYVGSTLDLENRIEEHNAGKSIFTSRYKPWILLHKEEHVNLKDARQREKYLKTAAGRKFIKRLLE